MINKKWMYIPTAFLIVSIVLNVVLLINIYTQEERITKSQANNFQEQLTEKDEKIETLNKIINNLETTIDDYTEKEGEDISTTTLGQQEKFKSVASEFLKAFFNYESNSLSTRTENLSHLVSDSLLKYISPGDVSEKEELSEDYSSSLENSLLYLTMDEEFQAAEVLADVSYRITDKDGEMELTAFYLIKLNKDDDGNILVTEYKMYTKS